MNTAIALAALTAIATTTGGFIAIKVKDRLHLVLGLSAGLLLGLVAFDLLPEVFEKNDSTFGNPNNGLSPSHFALRVEFIGYETR